MREKKINCTQSKSKPFQVGANTSNVFLSHPAFFGDIPTPRSSSKNILESIHPENEICFLRTCRFLGPSLLLWLDSYVLAHRCRAHWLFRMLYCLLHREFVLGFFLVFFDETFTLVDNSVEEFLLRGKLSLSLLEQLLFRNSQNHLSFLCNLSF